MFPKLPSGHQIWYATPLQITFQVDPDCPALHPNPRPGAASARKLCKLPMVHSRLLSLGFAHAALFLPNSPPYFHLQPVNTSTSQFRIHFLWDTFLDKPLPQDWLEPLLSASSTLVLIYTCSFSIMFLFYTPDLASRRLSIHVLNK